MPGSVVEQPQKPSAAGGFFGRGGRRRQSTEAGGRRHRMSTLSSVASSFYSSASSRYSGRGPELGKRVLDQQQLRFDRALLSGFAVILLWMCSFSMINQMLRLSGAIAVCKRHRSASFAPWLINHMSLKAEISTRLPYVFGMSTATSS